MPHAIRSRHLLAAATPSWGGSHLRVAVLQLQYGNHQTLEPRCVTLLNSGNSGALSDRYLLDERVGSGDRGEAGGRAIGKEGDGGSIGHEQTWAAGACAEGQEHRAN